jgi:electron transport complex protein RnfC
MTVATSFPAGLKLESHKQLALVRPLAVAPAPAQAVVALDQGSGDAATPCVAAGERVRIGMAIARHPLTGKAVLHAPIAGVVRAIESRASDAAAGRGTCVVIDNDGSDMRDATLAPLDGAEHLPPAELIERLSASGIVGLGGAAFSTAVKLAAALAGEATHLVLNGAECEPWICCDDVLLRERSARVVLGARLLLRASGASRCTIAIEDDKPEAIAAARAAVSAQSDDRLQVAVVPAVYPAGAERQLLAAVTGIEVPSGSVPSDVGLLCQNVGTAAAIADFVLTGLPCIQRIVTVTGSGVAAPRVLDARIGTPLAELISLCGGYTGRPQRLIAGGTLTGRALADDAAGLTKAMNCLVAATALDLVARGKEHACIRCGDCADVCPAGLLPQQLHRWIAVDDQASLARNGLADCIECGCCDYVCPSQIPLTQRLRDAKALLRIRQDETRRADDARRRHAIHQARAQAQAAAEKRAFDEARRRARGTDAD